jgi:hypothetical protein
MAWRGKRIWNRLKRKYSIGYGDCLVIMPHDDKVLNLCALKYLPSYMARKYTDRAFVLTGVKDMSDRIQDFENMVCILVSEDEIKLILKYYCLKEFRKMTVVVSFDEPYGSDGLLKKTGYTLDDLVASCIYG